MSSWSKRRKTFYAAIIIILLFGAVAVPAFLIFYKAPSCTDGIKNGKEKGLDCGGSCQRLCQSDFLQPSLAWTRFEELAPGFYNVAAYLVNPNTDGEAKNTQYNLSLYDADGALITETSGTVTLPPHRNTIAFKGAVSVQKRIPAKGLFEFTGAPDWNKKPDTLSALIIGDKEYIDEENSSSLTVKLRNNSALPINNLTVYVVLYDKDSNAIGFSKTFLDEILPQGSTVAPFTWPVNRQGKVISIEVLPVIE